ncbi:hypothetical protein ACPXB3_11210 [Gordonia sp. DT219]|uniref:hypothetical protein n=1 Tax=Gordonia sp. DT219 TaxID=3416658 RepID=UPI003CF3BD18
MSFAVISSSPVPASANTRRAVRDAVAQRIADPAVTRLIVEPGADPADSDTEPGDTGTARTHPDAHLAQVIAALMLTERLDVEVAYVAEEPTAATRAYGLPHGSGARELAERGHAVAVPLIRDDAATVLVGLARHLGAEGAELHGETYVDSHRLFTGEVRGIRIEPTPGEPGLRARLEGGALAALTGRRSWHRGRAVQTGGPNIVVEREGIASDRAVKRSTYYRHHVDLKLVLP